MNPTACSDAPSLTFVALAVTLVITIHPTGHETGFVSGEDTATTFVISDDGYITLLHLSATSFQIDTRFVRV